MRDRSGIAAGKVGFLGFERHRFADFAGANQFGLALDDAEQCAHHIHQVLGELARLGGRRGHRNGHRRRRRPRLPSRMLVHVWFPWTWFPWAWLPCLACCRISSRKMSLEMPMPPALAKFFEYCSVSIERHTPVPGVSPNGPSPFSPLVICANIELRNIASKSVAVERALACAAAGTLASASFSSRSACGRLTAAAKLAATGPELVTTKPDCITSPRYRPGWRRRP